MRSGLRLLAWTALVASATLANACASGPPPAGEALVHITQQSDGAADSTAPGERECCLILNDEDQQPAAICQDLAELSQAITTTVGNLEVITLKASPNGRTVMATKSSYVSDPPMMRWWP